MAAKGKTIIATIHQPSSQVKMPYTVTHHLIPYQTNYYCYLFIIIPLTLSIFSQVFALFDRVLLMAEGRVAYLGKTKEAQNFFSG